MIFGKKMTFSGETYLVKVSGNVLFSLKMWVLIDKSTNYFSKQNYAQILCFLLYNIIISVPRSPYMVFIGPYHTPF